ncbi:MAG: hypothetical protein HOP08_02350 [Cyclobacteriaceae bacterium]|nr:hypothetical protein [Cyclobacteriaceae bacterium]
MRYAHFFTSLTILIFATTCSGQVKNDLPKEKSEHPKLIKTIGNPRYGNVQCSLQDKAGNLWFGTTQNGLYKYDGKSFRQFLVADGLNSNNISSILEDKDGNIWIGTDAGVCFYDARLQDGRAKTFTKIQIPLRKNLPPNKFRNTHEVFSIMQSKSGTLWFATIDGVYTYVGQGSFTPFIIDESAMGYMSSNNNAERILEDKAGNIWFGGRGTHGVYRYDARLPLRAGSDENDKVAQGKSVTNIPLEDLFQDGPKPKAHNWAWPQLQDKNGNIWFSNWGGVYRYDGKTFTSFTKSDGLPGCVTRIIEDKKGNLWFGGDASTGLSRYDARLPLRVGSDENDKVGQGMSITHFTAEDGLLNNSIWSILEDTSGNIWVGTRETGLYLYDARLPDGQGKTFTTYSEYKP